MRVQHFLFKKRRKYESRVVMRVLLMKIRDFYAYCFQNIANSNLILTIEN